MILPGPYIADAFFAAVYAILLCPSVINVVRHGFNRKSGYLALLVFCAVRIAGNALVVDAYETGYQNFNIVIAGYILQASGYSFLLICAVALYSRAHLAAHDSLPVTADENERQQQRYEGRLGSWRWRVSASARQYWSKENGTVRIAHGLNLAALVLTIIGYSNTIVFDGLPTSSTRLDGAARAGSIIYAVLTGSLIVLVSRVASPSLQPFSQVPHQDSRLISKYMVIALPFMLARCIYFVYVVFDSNPFYQVLD